MPVTEEHLNVDRVLGGLPKAKNRRRLTVFISGGLIVGFAVTGVIAALLLGLVPGIGQPPSDAELAADVMRSVTTDVTSAVPEQYKEVFGADLVKAFPAGTEVNPLVDTWAADGVAGGSMNVELTVDAQVTTVRAIFGNVNDSWLLVTMEDVE